jgi:nucleoside-diphosphate-sugar epimerase
LPSLPKSDLTHIFNHTCNLWEEMRGARLFITGGTGFFGCWLLESFIWTNDHLMLGARATVLSRDPDGFRDKMPHLANHPAIDLIKGDVRTFEFPAGEYGYVIHAAADASAKLNQENPLLIFETIVEGTRRTLEFARTHGTHKFLLTSSGAVYGKQPLEMTHIPEDYPGAPDPTDPGSAYGEGKRAAELLCSLYAHQCGLEVKVARCFAFVGPYLPLDAHFAIGNFIRDGLAGGPIVVKGDGTNCRSYLYAADLTIWLWKLLFMSKICYPVNVGSDFSVSIAELANIVRNIINPDIEIRILEKSLSGIPPQKYVPDITIAQEKLGLLVWINLLEAIRRTYIGAKIQQSDGKL